MFIQFDDQIINTDFIISFSKKHYTEMGDDNKLKVTEFSVVCELFGREKGLCAPEEFYELDEKDCEARYQYLKSLLSVAKK